MIQPLGKDPCFISHRSPCSLVVSSSTYSRNYTISHILIGSHEPSIFDLLFALVLVPTGLKLLTLPRSLDGTRTHTHQLNAGAPPIELLGTSSTKGRPIRCLDMHFSFRHGATTSTRFSTAPI